MVSVSGGAAKEILKGYIQGESRLTTLFEYISNEKDSKHYARGTALFVDRQCISKQILMSMKDTMRRKKFIFSVVYGKVLINSGNISIFQFFLSHLVCFSFVLAALQFFNGHINGRWNIRLHQYFYFIVPSFWI